MSKNNEGPRCFLCGGKMIWNSDFNYDEVYDEGEGIVSYWTCSECGAEYEVSKRDDDPDEYIDEDTEDKVSNIDDDEIEEEDYKGKVIML